MDYQTILITIFAVLAALLTPVIYVFMKVYVRNSSLSIEKQRIELEMFRKSLENTIYSTTEKIASNKERWEDVNHMVFEAARRSIHNSDKNENQFLESLSIKRPLIEIDHNKAFLLAPLNPRFKNQVDIIKMACEDIGIDCETADEEFISGPILSVIVKKMLTANLIIAVIDGRNPNVFYELGLAHAFGKTVVMISGGLENIPFDIQSQRMVIVDWKNNESIERIRRAIAESMRWTNRTF